MSAITVLPQILLSPVAVLPADIAKDDLCAFLAEFLHNCSSDASCSTRYNRFFAFKLHFFLPFIGLMSFGHETDKA